MRQYTLKPAEIIIPKREITYMAKHTVTWEKEKSSKIRQVIEKEKEIPGQNRV